MSYARRFPRLPNAYAERRHGRRASGPRYLNGRPIPWERLFEPSRSEVLWAHEVGEPLQHCVGFEEVRRGGRLGLKSLIPHDLAEQPGSSRLDAFVDVGEHSELVARWSMGFLSHRVRTDRCFQADLVLEYLWGPAERRRWHLEQRPDVELAVRLPPLLGRTSHRDLVEVVETIFGPDATVRLYMSSPRDETWGDLASLLATPPDWSKRDSGSRTPRMPPVIGPMPIQPPEIVLRISEEGAAFVDELGYCSADSREDDEKSAAICFGDDLLLCFKPVHALARTEVVVDLADAN